MKTLREAYQSILNEASNKEPFSSKEIKEIENYTSKIVNELISTGNMMDIPYNKWKFKDNNEDAAEIELRARSGGKQQILWTSDGKSVSVDVTIGTKYASGDGKTISDAYKDVIDSISTMSESITNEAIDYNEISNSDKKVAEKVYGDLFKVRKILDDAGMKKNDKFHKALNIVQDTIFEINK